MSIATGLVELRSGLLHGLEAQRVSLRCLHGESTFFLLPGKEHQANEAALDVGWVRHIRRHGCECERASLSAPRGRHI